MDDYNLQTQPRPPQDKPRNFFKRLSRKKYISIAVVVVLVAGAAGARAMQLAGCDPLVMSCPSFLNVTQSPSISGADAKTSDLKSANDISAASLQGDCKLDAKLMSACRPLIGATSNSYPGVSAGKASIEYFEKRAHRQLDIVHTYHTPDKTVVNAEEKAFYNRSGTLLYMNWKPDTNWGPAGGGNATVNGKIDKMADSIKALGSKKLYLTLTGEPENDVSPGGSKCTNAKGNKGTTQDYRDMWKNVRKRFDAKGVKNVVWTMNYMGYVGWDCSVKDLWPGNDLVDWITWDPYTDDKGTFKGDMSRFYNFLAANTDASHAFTSKNWGIAEMGYIGTDQKKAYKYYDDMLSVVKKNDLPRLKMYMFFDMGAAGFNGPAGWDARIGYAHGTLDATEQQHFNTMFDGIASLGTPQKPPEPTPTQPTDPATPAQPGGGSGGTSGPVAPISVSGVAEGTTVRGVVNLSGVTHTSGKVQYVALRVDNNWIATDTSSPYKFAFDTRKLSDGKHTLILRVQAAGKKYDSATVSFTVNNTPVSSDPVIVQGIKNGATLKGSVGLSGVTRAQDHLKVLTLRVDGTWMATDSAAPYTFTLNTKKLKNGRHTLILRGWGSGVAHDSKTITFTVAN